MRVLIVGGYGVFGGRLVQLLADEQRLTLIVAGRSIDKAEAFCATLPGPEAELEAARFDRNGDLEAQLKAIHPDILVDASGPFQDYGDEPYRLVEAALTLGISYLDLADGSDFVEGISRYDITAKERGVFALSGVSSFPVLSAAVVRHLSHDLARVDTISGGIAPSPYAGVGYNVICAIAGYAGKKIPLTRDGKSSFGIGFTETWRYTICPPGRLPLKNTLFSLVDVPDLRLLPPLWPGLRSIWMAAGPVPELLHRGLIALAWLVRLRLLPSIAFLAPVFFRVINIFRWGEHRGGMFIAINGARADGSAVARSWHLLAEGDDGPFIPSMAIEAIVRKLLDRDTPAAGARAATEALELADYDALFAKRTIYTGTRNGAREANKPLYAQVLGDAWEVLPPQIRAMHSGAPDIYAEGRASVERGSNIISRAIGWLFRFPTEGTDIPVTVHIANRNGRETWTRDFDGHKFSSVQFAGRGRSDQLVEERFGPFTFGLALVRSDERLNLVVRRWRFLGIPLPRALAPSGDAHEFVADDSFNFHVEIRLPLVGVVVRYRGNLVMEE